MKKITDNRWLNLFGIKKPGGGEYFFASRKNNPHLEEADDVDAVVIVAYVQKPDRPLKMVITKEFRIPINDFEYGLPAGLIDNGEAIITTVERELFEETGLGLINIIHSSPRVYSSSGMTDESVCIVFVTADGEITTNNTENSEIIEPMMLDAGEVNHLLSSDKKIGAKGWAIMDHFARTGKMWIGE